ncbi:MAG: NAD(P)H-binding protein [Capsulimonadales bacterium]|nr:NAD(P)H-binding protein [Capsulimonadales bacterium]
MKIVVTTATGHIGSRVVPLLMQAGARPTLLVRRPERLGAAVRAACDVRQGDMNHLDDVLQATADADALFWLIPTDDRSEDPIGDILRSGRLAADAIRQNGISRIVLLSSAGAARREATLIGALGQVEDLLNATGAHLCHLRPGCFFTNLLSAIEPMRQGVYPTAFPLEAPLPWNDPRDIGDIVAARLLSGEWTGQSVQGVYGPEHLTFRQVLSIAAEAVGRPIEPIPISEEEEQAALIGAGMTPAVAVALTEMARTIATAMETEPERDFITTTPTTLGAWCYANLRPALAENP